MWAFMGFQGNFMKLYFFQGFFNNQKSNDLDGQLMAKKHDPKYTPKFIADASNITEKMWLPAPKNRGIPIFVIET